MKNIIILFILSLGLFSCEQDVTNVTLPYVEKIVVRSYLQADRVISVNISKTLPPLDDYSFDKAKITNAKVIITVDGEEFVLSADTGGYYQNPALIGKALKTYYLKVEWNNLQASAQTIIPPKPKIDSSNVEYSKTLSDNWYGYQRLLIGYFKANDDYRYLLGVSFDSTRVGYDSDTLYSYYSGKDGYVKGVADYSYSQTYDTTYNPFTSYYITLRAFDKQYADYYNSKYNGSSESDLFGTGSSNVIWNVKGDALGIFIGMSSCFYKIE